MAAFSGMVIHQTEINISFDDQEIYRSGDVVPFFHIWIDSHMPPQEIDDTRSFFKRNFLYSNDEKLS